jgi:hypothetical protein
MESSGSIGLAAGFVVAAAAAVGAYRVRGSTAVPAAWWGIAAGLALAAERFSANPPADDAATLACRRLCLVALGLCPGMSLLGAKRPQHGVWQAIVASLAVVILLPAATAALVRPGSPPDVHLLSRFLVAAIIAVGWLNHAATRRAAPAAALALGQALLARPFLPWGSGAVAAGDPVDALGTGLVVVAVVAAAVWPAAPRTGPHGSRPEGDPSAAWRGTEAAWIAFRETFGAAWTLRVAERFDTVAREQGWPCRLAWAGCEAGAGGPADWPRDARRTFIALLRRFVTPAWLERHGLPVRYPAGPFRMDRGPEPLP